jgi:SNF2 family DNA or RNA helicase
MVCCWTPRGHSHRPAHAHERTPTTRTHPHADEDDDARYAQDELGDQPFHDHGYEDLADAASGKGAFDVMLTTYTLFERVGASNRCVLRPARRQHASAPPCMLAARLLSHARPPHTHMCVCVPRSRVCGHSADRSFLRKWKWSQMVMDEAHALKNANSQRSKRLRKLARGARGAVRALAG